MIIIIILLFLITPAHATINQLTGWGNQDVSILNDNLRAISSTTGIQQINILNDLSSPNSISVLNDNINMISRQLSISGLSQITGFDDKNLSVLNNDLILIEQNTGA